MPQGMRNKFFTDIRRPGSQTKERIKLCSRKEDIYTVAEEEMFQRTVLFDIPLQIRKKAGRQGDIAVFTTFALTDMNHHPIPVNVINSHVQCFTQAKATGIDQSKEKLAG